VYRNLQEYTQQVRFHKNRLEKTLAYLLFQGKVSASLTEALKMIQNGNVLLNNRKITVPNYICTPRDVISIVTEKGIRKIQLNAPA
jgi:ribosomal protein S4